jgi:hypothetical protein
VAAERLNAWPKPILQADGTPKAPAPAAAPKAKAKK